MPALRSLRQTSSQTSQRGLCGKVVRRNRRVPVTDGQEQGVTSSHHLSDVPPNLPNPMSEYEPLDYDAPDQPSFLLMLTNDSDYMSPHYFSPNNNTHLDNPRRSRPSLVVSNYLSPAIPSSPLLTFHPSHRLSVNFSQTGIPHLFPKS